MRLGNETAWYCVPCVACHALRAVRCVSCAACHAQITNEPQNSFLSITTRERRKERGVSINNGLRH